MSIPYRKESDVTLAGRVSTTVLNKIFQRLVANDNSVLPSSYGIPYVWEATWFNNPSAPGYKRGDAVWINTEEHSVFIQENKERIYNYLYNNPEYRERVIRYGQDQKRLYELYTEVIDSGKLYWLGDILKPAQLRVCTSDNVKTPPDDDRYWEDFFVLKDDEKLKKQTIGEFQRITDGQFDEHLSAYHPESYPEFDEQMYMNSDFSNASLLQRYTKPQIVAMDGLDTIKKFVCKRYGVNSVKWFRIWSSGFLEHGGIVDTQEIHGRDSDEYGQTKGQFFTVQFDWQYDNNLAAPTYDYQNTSIAGFHFADAQIELSSDASKIPYDDTAELGEAPRYVVSVTPHNTGESVYSHMDSQYGVYNTKEVLSMKNKSFTFLINPDCRYYSYYASGFTINISKYF